MRGSKIIGSFVIVSVVVSIGVFAFAGTALAQADQPCPDGYQLQADHKCHLMNSREKRDRQIASVSEHKAESVCAKAFMKGFVENIGANMLEIFSDHSQKEKIAAWREQEKVELFGPDSQCGITAEYAYMASKIPTVVEPSSHDEMSVTARAPASVSDN